MEINNIDKNIKEKFANRTFEPSASAWERLSSQLDQQPQKKKKGWFFYIGAAASILLLVSIGFQLFSDNTIEDKPMKEIIVVSPIDTNVIETKIDKFINEISPEKVLVKIDEVEEKEIKNNIKNTAFIETKKKSHIKKKSVLFANNEIETIKLNVDKNPSENNPSAIKKEALQLSQNSRIKINSDDLLYAVTHNKGDVKTYYSKYKINREDVLKTIRKTLKKSNIKVDSHLILAEVERTIDEDDFQNNFMKSLKRKVSDLALVIASRND
jgi:Uri superfamily endonuclease